MSESLGLKVVNRVEETDRLPFVKALAHIATADDTVDLNEKQMVDDYTDAWDLDEEDSAQVRSILEAEHNVSLDELTASFSESGTRFLLMQELMRLSYADGSYGNAERKEIAAIAQRMGMSERQFREVEKWVGRGQAWEESSAGDEHEGDLEDVLGNQEEDDDDEYDLSDIETGNSDLADIDPGGYEIDEEEMEEIEDEIEDDVSDEEDDEADGEDEPSKENA